MIPRRHTRAIALPLRALAPAVLGGLGLALALSGPALADVTGAQMPVVESATDVEDQPAMQAPLAQRSLLLDVARAGDRFVSVGERGHILVSEDGGIGWRQVEVPTSAMLTGVWFASERLGWAVGHDAVILRSDDRGETWAIQHRDLELESPLLDVWFRDEQRGFAIGAYGLFLETRDGGETWEQRSISERDSHYNAIFAAPDGTLYIAGEFGLLLTSADEGESWSEIETPYEASYFGGLALPDGSIVIFGLRGNAYRFEPAASSFTKLATGTQSSLMGGSVVGPDALVIGGADGVMLTGRIAADRLEVERRRDRGTIAAVLPGPDGGALLVGAFGTDRWVEPAPTPTRAP